LIFFNIIFLFNPIFSYFFFCSLRCSRTNYYIPFFSNHTKRERETKNNKKNTHTQALHTYTQKDRKKSTTMNNKVLISLKTNEQNSYGLLVRRLALITGRLVVASSLTLKGLFSGVETVGGKLVENALLTVAVDGAALN